MFISVQFDLVIPSVASSSSSTWGRRPSSRHSSPAPPTFPHTSRAPQSCHSISLCVHAPRRDSCYLRLPLLFLLSASTTTHFSSFQATRSGYRAPAGVSMAGSTCFIAQFPQCLCQELVDLIVPVKPWLMRAGTSLEYVTQSFHFVTRIT